MDTTAFQALALMTEFGTADIPAERVGEKYFGLNAAQTRKRITSGGFPVRAYRLGGQKSPWLVNVYDLAALISQARAQSA